MNDAIDFFWLRGWGFWRWLLNANTKNQLAEIGRQLDRGIFPEVKNGGFVSPSGSAVFPSALGKEQVDESKRPRRSPAEPWAGSRPWQGAPGGTWPSGETAPLVCADEGAPYEAELDAIRIAYPGVEVWRQEGGFWLYVESAILPGLGRRAVFLVGVWTDKRAIRSWAFWGGRAPGYSWIGPRHTNFPDGSICAFEPRDGTWVFGDPLVELLDLYSVWALRHLHYEAIGRWPGPQAVGRAYERLLELADDELCGCGSFVSYDICCKSSDLKRNRVADAVNFCSFTEWSLRQPPASVLQFVGDRSHQPHISKLA